MNEEKKQQSAAVKARVMIVEDEAIVSKDILASLVSLGYEVCGEASSGADALALATKTGPDLILMDIMLKGDLDGIETAKRIKAQLDIPVIFLTAYSDEATVGRAKITNAFGYLLKPFEESELRTTIEMALYKNETERKLKNQRQWLETILRCIADAVITTNNEGIVEFANPVAEALAGLKVEEMLGSPLSDVINLRSPKLMTPIEIPPGTTIESSTTLFPENNIVLIARDGRQTDVEYSAAPLKPANGKTEGMVLVIRDIGGKLQALEREQALQRRLFRAQRMESLGMLANGVAEQLHRIIGPIIDYPAAILSKMPPDNNIRQDLAMIQNSAQKAIDILGDLITLGHMRDYTMEKLQLNELLEKFAGSAQFKAQKERSPLIEFKMELASDLPAIIGCQQYLDELFANLIAHASSAATGAGMVRIITRFASLNEPNSGFEVIETGNYAVLEIAYPGQMLDEEGINRFFEPFADKAAMADRRFGHGLRTAVAYAIIKGHKALIDIKSSRDKGTEIYIYFPAWQVQPETAGEQKDVPVKLPEQKEGRARQGEGIDVQGIETIMVVDDDSDLRKTATAYLRSKGYKVIAAQNGNEAVELLKKAAENNEHPVDLVVLDMIMPGGFDGLETYQAFLKSNPRQKAVMVSGFAGTERIKKAQQIGVGECLLKPYELDDLARAVRRELDKPARDIT